MKQIFSLLLPFSFMCCSSFAQTLKGIFKVNENWRGVVYICPVNHYQDVFGFRAETEADSTFTDEDGIFRFYDLKPGQLYKIWLNPVGVTQQHHVIQNGANDNFAFFIIPDNFRGDIYLNADMDSLYLSFNLNATDSIAAALNRSILHFRQIKMPLNTFMAEMKTRMEQGSAATRDSIAARAMPVMIALSDSTNEILLDDLSKTENDWLKGLGLAYYGIDINRNTETYPGIIHSFIPGTTQNPLLASIAATVPQDEAPGIAQLLSINNTLIDDRTLRLEDMNTEVIVLDFWASWCMPCRKSIRTDLKALAAQYSPDHLAVIGVNLDEDKKNALNAIKADNNNFIQIYEGLEGQIGEMFAISGIPFYVIINKKTQEVKQFSLMEKLTAYLASLPE